MFTHVIPSAEIGGTSYADSCAQQDHGLGLVAANTQTLGGTTGSIEAIGEIQASAKD